MTVIRRRRASRPMPTFLTEPPANIDDVEVRSDVAGIDDLGSGVRRMGLAAGSQVYANRRRE